MHRFSAFWLKSIIMPPLRSRGGGILWRRPSRTGILKLHSIGKQIANKATSPSPLTFLFPFFPPPKLARYRLNVEHCKLRQLQWVRSEVSSAKDDIAVVQWQSIGLVTERLRVRLTPGPLQSTLSKLLTYCVLRPTQPPTLSGTGNEQQLTFWAAE